MIDLLLLNALHMCKQFLIRVALSAFLTLPLCHNLFAAKRKADDKGIATRLLKRRRLEQETPKPQPKKNKGKKKG